MPGTVLLFGRNSAMMALVERQLTSAGMSAVGYMEETILMAELAKGATRIVVIGGGVEDEPRQRVKKYCLDKEILVFEHTGGPQDLPDTIARAIS